MTLNNLEGVDSGVQREKRKHFKNMFFFFSFVLGLLVDQIIFFFFFLKKKRVCCNTIWYGETLQMYIIVHIRAISWRADNLYKCIIIYVLSIGRRRARKDVGKLFSFYNKQKKKEKAKFA